MPYNSKQPHYNTPEHPLKQALRQSAANGQTPTAAELGVIPGYTSDPVIRSQVDQAVRSAAALHNSGSHGEAVRVADDAVARIGQATAHLPMPEDHRAPEPSIQDLGASMFHN